MAENKIRFSPVRGTQSAIDSIEFTDGSVYFATDSKMVWLDTYVVDKNTGEKVPTRLLMGNGTGGGSSSYGFIYADAIDTDGSLEQPNLEVPIYYIYRTAFPEDLVSMPQVDTLIINSDGKFFRVIEQGIGEFGDRVTAELIASGTGGGGSESKAEDIKIQMISFPTNLINGKDADVVFIPHAAKNRNGEYIDDFVNITWKLEYTENGTSFIQYATGSLSNLPVNEEYRFNFGAKAKYSSHSRLTLIASELNSTKIITRSDEFFTSDLTLTLPSHVSNVNVFEASSVTLSCYQEGNMDKILDFYWDDALIHSVILDNSSEREQSLAVNDYVDEITHGYHKVKMVLSQYIGNVRGFSVEPIEFEIATRDPQDTTPIIWLGSYQSTYYNYDNIQIPFRIYVPNGSMRIHLYKDGKEIEGSPRTITETGKFSIFEIVDFDLDMLNNYAISYEEVDSLSGEFVTVIRQIEFTVTQDPKRKDFNIAKKDYLTLSFDASGRSNSESSLKRASWSYTKNGEKVEASFENFNWYNNGWITENGKTCLRISNGAKFSIPIGDMVFAGQNSNEQSHSFEFQFKIRNVQDYSNLIHNVTRYNNDQVYYDAFYDSSTGTYRTEYTNYDAFLANYFKTNNIPYHDDKTNTDRYMEYDDLEFLRVEKQINLSAVACGFFSGNNQSVTGICLGPQDAFFSNGTNTVNVDYVEDTIINLSAVYSHDTENADQRLMYIYINGVLTGVIRNSLNDSFAVTSADSTPKALVFNSNYCDIDLYKIRFYRIDLNVNDVVTNFAVDLKDVIIYDQNKLAISNEAVKEYQFNYRNMMTYNENHLDSPIMPYIIFDTSKTNNNDKLSYAKSVKLNIGVEFVNTPLELAYTSGELETLSGPNGDGLWTNQSTQEEKAAAVKKYYQHHCPSWKGEGIQMAVQGTSSEFYPRRNYKLKTKGDDGVNIFLNRGPFEMEYSEDPESTRQSYWYMDNYTAGTTKFTMKIDYMESSGTYNMGFANLVKNAYSKHPFNDLNNAHAFEEYDMDQTSYEEASSYKAGTTYYYKNHKGNWKNTTDDDLQIQSAEDFALGPVAFAAANGIVKVLTETSEGWANEDNHQYYNKWYKAVFGYKDYTIPNTNDYRTSVQGFRTLAFHKKSDGSYTYIGMYNMLLDKGSDEMYGFKPDKTTGKDIFQKYLGHKKISKIAECWEFENNSRTFCSFRDPMNRKDLSFNVYTLNSQNQRVPTLNSMRSAPVIVDSFEYRYHPDADILDYIMDPDKNGDKYTSSDTAAYIAKNGDIAWNKEDTSQNYELRESFIFDRYKNWEKAVAWVWSTNTDSVLSGGTYREVDGIGNTWRANTYYLLERYVKDSSDTWDEDQQYYTKENNQYVATQVTAGTYTPNEYYIRIVGDNYVPDTDEAYHSELNYYVKDGDLYNAAFLGTIPYEANKYYVIINGTYVLSTETTYDPSYTYYEFITMSDQDMAQGNYDRLVERCAADAVFDSNETYYTYDGEQPAGQAVTAVNITAEEFAADPTQYCVGIEVSYGTETNRHYRYDTKEYRADKFMSELSKHFDIEYLSTYFVMTEVFECYDSRGKNAMFASWGPQEAGGEYIWYPIFYDIDTQLGINNTGIPSFEYNVDATENGNYSTSDSVLWNNFYKYFKSSRILMKYKQLKGITEGIDPAWGNLRNPPLRTVSNIEGWYRTDPEVCKSIVMRGKRPLIATNLDEYYKYITITNRSSYQNGVTGYLASDTSGSWTYDSNGTYFYALQGDRSLSRQQFLSNRLEYIDSWLNQGNYARGGNNRMWGRVAANNPSNTSDVWVEDLNDANTSYYLPNGQKRHLFDAEYWLTLTPTHSTYVTLGDDNEAYPSRKYNGINPVKFEISSIENGVRRSLRYPEQLLYVYGMNQMADVGDMSNMYWQEFKIEGEAKHLTRLLLGYDGLVTENGESIRWHNDKLNPPTLPASKESSGMPLLKEVNMSNIQISGGDTPVLNLTSCEKLKNFRATGSNLSEVKFAEGVALDTLYLPSSITVLELTEARLLTKVLDTYTTPVANEEGKLVAEQGLWIDGLFDNNTTNLNRLNINGGSLGYDSYKLLKKCYIARGSENPTKELILNMTGVNWSPYTLVEDGDEYSGNASDYREIDNHFGLVEYHHSEGDWAIRVANHEIYKYNGATAAQVSQISDITMFNTFVSSNNYKGLNGASVPNITGTIYVDNDVAVDEAVIRNGLQKRFPGLTFFFKTVTKRPTARFVYFDETGYIYHYVSDEPPSIQTLSSNVGNEWFTNPLTIYENLDKKLNNYDFFGWGVQVDDSTTGDDVYTIGDKKYQVVVSTDGGSWTRPEGTLENDYTFYAIFILHRYKRTFINDDHTPIKDIDGSNLINYQTYSTGYGVDVPKDKNGREIIPSSDLPDTPENFYYVNIFKGWADIRKPAMVVDLSKLSIGADYNFIAVYEKKSVYHEDSILDVNYLDISDLQINGSIKLKSQYYLKGKVTLPTQIDGTPVTALAGFRGTNNAITHIFFAPDNRQVTTIMTGCFADNTTLRYIEPISSLTVFEQTCFSRCTALSGEVLSDLLANATDLNATLVTDVGSQYSNNALVLPGNSYNKLVNRALSNLYWFDSLTIGSLAHPCDWVSMLKSGKLQSNSQLFDSFGSNSGVAKIHIYLPSSAITQELSKETIQANLLSAFSLTQYADRMEQCLNVEPGQDVGFAWIWVD